MTALQVCLNPHFTGRTYQSGDWANQSGDFDKLSHRSWSLNPLYQQHD
ncbi:MAG: hypothetical protein IKX38_01945 [Bacteroidales bacterium]|nr:hypothetical protein [Bacteroidales bacterium]